MNWIAYAFALAVGSIFGAIEHFAIGGPNWLAVIVFVFVTVATVFSLIAWLVMRRDII